MSYVGSSGVVNSALWMRPDSGISSFAQLMAAKEKVVLGALSATSQDSMVPALLAQNGVPVRVIRGYNSSAKVLLAVEQGEVPGIFHIVDGFAKRPDLLEQKVVVPILQTQPVFKGLPLVRDVIRASDRPLLNLVLAGEEFGVLVAGPPGHSGRCWSSCARRSPPWRATRSTRPSQPRWTCRAAHRSMAQGSPP